MNKRTVIVTTLSSMALSGIMLLTACSGPSGSQGKESPSAPASSSGKALFEANCAACHGTNGAGGIVLGKVTSSDLRQSSLGPKYGNDVSLLRRAILEGKNSSGKDLDTVMTRWKDKLSDQEVSTIVAYLATLK